MISLFFFILYLIFVSLPYLRHLQSLAKLCVVLWLFTILACAVFLFYISFLKVVTSRSSSLFWKLCLLALYHKGYRKQSDGI